MALIEFINSNRLPFNMVNDLSFKNFVQVVQKHPTWKPPSRPTVSGPLLNQGYSESLEHVAEIIRCCERLALTTDGWSGPKGQSYWSVTVHGISENGELHVAILACLAIYKSHTAVNIANSLRPILEKVGLTDEKMSAWVTDEGGAAPCIAGHFGCPAIHCAGHLLQTVLRRSFKIAGERSPVLVLIIEVSKTVVKLFINSSERRQQLKSLQRQHGLSMRSLKNNVETRWNSVLATLKSVRDNEKPILNWILNHEMDAKNGHLYLLQANRKVYWIIVSELVSILELFEEVTAVLSMSFGDIFYKQ